MEMDPAVLKQLFMGAVPPGIAATVLFALLWGIKRPEGSNWATWRPLLAPLALAGLYVLFHALLFGAVSVPPMSSQDWLASVIVLGGLGVAALFAIVGREARVARRAVALVMGLALLTGTGWLSSASARRSWNAQETALQLGIYVGITAAAVVGMEVVARRRRGFSAPVALLAFAAGTSQVLVLGFQSLKLSQSAGLWAAFAGGAMVIAFWRRKLSLASGGAALSAAAVMTALHQGRLFGYANASPWLYTALAAASPLLAAAATLPRLPERGWKRIALQLLPGLLAVLPLAAGALMAAMQTQPEYEY